jgi:hypothetical protein
MDVDDEEPTDTKDDPEDPEDPDDPTLLPLSFYTSALTVDLLLPPFLTPSKPIVLSSGHIRPANATYSTPGALVQNNQIWQALRDSVIDVCGDVGWGKVASSLQGSSDLPRGSKGRSHKALRLVLTTIAHLYVHSEILLAYNVLVYRSCRAGTCPYSMDWSFLCQHNRRTIRDTSGSRSIR